MSSNKPFLLAYDVYEPVKDFNHALSPVIFLHCVTGSKKYWFGIPQRVANATKRKVYVLDARNHGDSAWSDDFSFEIIAEDVADFMGRHGIRKAALMGHSMGGIESIYLALNKPELVEKVVVEDMIVRKVQQPLVDMVAAMVQLLQASLAEIPEGADEEEAFRVLTDILERHMPPTNAPLKMGTSLDRIFDIKRGEDGRFAFKGNMSVLLRGLQEYEATWQQPEGTFENPALFIYGAMSPYLVGKEEDSIKTHFPNAEFLGIEGASHMVHVDNPEEFEEAVIKFISS